MTPFSFTHLQNSRKGADLLTWIQDRPELGSFGKKNVHVLFGNPVISKVCHRFGIWPDGHVAIHRRSDVNNIYVLLGTG